MLDPSCNATGIQAIREAKTKHLQFMRSERMGYYMRRDRAAASPRRYCSFIIDGADQKSYGLPHFTFSTKGDRGQNGLCCHVSVQKPAGIHDIISI